MRHQIRSVIGATLGFLVAGSVAVLLAQGIRVMSGSSTSLASVTAGNALEVVFGRQDRQTYVLSVANQAVTATESVFNLEAEAGRGFRILKLCIQAGFANSSGSRRWQLIRTTSASSGGVTIAPEAVGNTVTGLANAKMDPAAATWSGTARVGGTEGAFGATLAQGMVAVPVVVSGSTQITYEMGYYCEEFQDAGQYPTVLPGTANGVSLMFQGVAGGTNLFAKLLYVAN